MLSWFTKWKAFFSPIPGWKERLLQFRSGKTTWPVPYDEYAPKVIPWPIEWIPHRRVLPTDDEADKTRGFVFLDTVCAESGLPAKIGEGALCVRCGIPLHPARAHMITSIDPPKCPRCAWLIKFAVL